MSLTIEQRKERMHFLGSSDAAAVLGLSRWKTPLKLWTEKTGILDEEPEQEKLYQTMGSRLEEVVAEMFTDKTGFEVRRVTEPRVHPQHPFLSAQIDRLVLNDDAILECKTTNSFKAKEWEEDEIPQEYIIQVNHQLAVTGKKKAYIACLIGNQEFQVKEIKRDEVVLKILVEREVAFWNNFVVPKIMPGMITAKDGDTLYQLFPLAEPVTLDLGDDVAKMAEDRAAMIADSKLLEANIDRLENEMKAKLGDAESATAGQYLITWKNQKQDRLDQKRLAVEQPELVAKYRAITEFRRFEAKIQKSKGRK